MQPTLGLFLGTSLNIYSAQDYIKENQELDRLLANSSQRDRDQLNMKPKCLGGP